MHSDKRYTNATFTKRVDHNAWRQAARGASEPAVCEACGAVYADRRWTSRKPAAAARADNKHRHFRPAQMVICPACQQVRHGVPNGYVYLDGAFLALHREEIERLLRNEAERTSEDNPLARVMEWSRGDGHQLTLATTTEHLAQRLGRALEKAFSGEVRYDFSHENKLARVYWRRD
jgi:hypothetical protein